MKLETKVALIQLANTLQMLAAGTMLVTGIETATKLTAAAQTVIEALNKEDVEL